MAAGRHRALDSDDEIELAKMHARGLTQHECAEAFNVDPRTIRRVGDRLGLVWSGTTRDDIEGNTKARHMRIRAKRAALAEDLLDDARKLRDQLFSEYVDSSFVGGQNPTHMTAKLDKPKAKDQADIVRAISQIIERTDKVLSDPEDKAEAAVSVLSGLADAIALADAGRTEKSELDAKELEVIEPESSNFAAEPEIEVSDQVVVNGVCKCGKINKPHQPGQCESL